MGFRVVVKLSKYFTDERSSCYIYVNDNIKLVNNLEKYLCDLFNLEGKFCLLKDNSLLPSCENINVLQAEDIVSVIPLAEKFKYNCSNALSAEDVGESFDKDVKKKKRKKNKETNSADISNIDLDGEEKQLNKENISMHCSPVKSKVAGNNELFTAIKNIEEYHSKLYPKDDEDELEAMKTKALNTLKEHFPVNINGVSEGRIKKRKRIRIRKSKKNNSMEMIHSDSDSNKVQKNSSLLISNGKKGSHIRFNAVEKPVNILQNEIIDKIDKTPRIIRAIKSNSSSNANTILSVNGVQNGSTADISDTEDFSKVDSSYTALPSTMKSDELAGAGDCANNMSINHLIKQIDSHSVINIADVKQNNIILFKMLKMNENYTPVVSDYILGKVLDSDTSLRSMKLSIIDGQSECAAPSGKFDLEETDDVRNETDFNMTWDQVIAPRLILS